MKQNALNWFEIYVSDIARSKAFYEGILSTTMEEPKMEGMEMAMFPYNQEKGVGGAIIKMDLGQPGGSGTIIYLNAEGEIDEIVARIPEQGGKVIKERTAIPPHGFIALFEDPDANLVGLHSMS